MALTCLKAERNMILKLQFYTRSKIQKYLHSAEQHWLYCSNHTHAANLHPMLGDEMMQSLWLLFTHCLIGVL